jgi:hypothetical protein
LTSPSNGQPMCAMCSLIWCVRPVCNPMNAYRSRVTCQYARLREPHFVARFVFFRRQSRADVRFFVHAPQTVSRPAVARAHVERQIGRQKRVSFWSNRSVFRRVVPIVRRKERRHLADVRFLSVAVAERVGKRAVRLGARGERQTSGRVPVQAVEHGHAGTRLGREGVRHHPQDVVHVHARGLVHHDKPERVVRQERRDVRDGQRRASLLREDRPPRLLRARRLPGPGRRRARPRPRGARLIRARRRHPSPVLPGRPQAGGGVPARPRLMIGWRRGWRRRQTREGFIFTFSLLRAALASPKEAPDDGRSSHARHHASSLHLTQPRTLFTYTLKPFFKTAAP